MGEVNKCIHSDACRLLISGLHFVEGCNHDMCQYFKKKGKVYSKVNQGQRVSSDRYQTPLSMISQLLDVKKFESDLSFLEPADGKGSIVYTLHSYGYDNIVNYDIDNTPVDQSLEESEFNFFNEKRKFDCIITNPPYRLATEFIVKASETCLYEFVFLMPLNYLHGQKRLKNIYKNRSFSFRLEKLWIFSRMPMLTDTLRKDGMYNTGMQVYAWYLFSRGHKGLPEIDWIDNNKYVIRGKNGNNKTEDK